jgi:hypothetical protein
MDERSRHRQFEDRFLNQLRARALALVQGKLPADEVAVQATPEGIDAVRAELSRLEVYDRGVVEKLAGTRSLQMLFQKRLFGGLFRSTVSRVRVRVLASVEALLNDETPGPVGREQVLDALASYEVLPRRDKPTGVILASATGFTAEARSLVEGSSPPTLILMGGREDGGWDVTMPPPVRSTPWAKLFELESQDERVQRLLRHLDENANLVDSRGLSMSALAEKLGLSAAETEGLVRQACRSEPRLMTVVHEGRTHICRTPLAEEGNAMSIWSRIRKLLRLKPTTAERVRALTAQRVKIEQDRFELDQKVNALEGDERQLIQQGAAAPSDAERKQVAGKLVRARRELRRQRAQAQLYTQQIDIIGTHLHHLTLAEKGKRLELPKAEDLTREAAQAEQVMAELSANADLAASIEVTGETPMMAEEEAAILEEFKQVAASQAAAPEAPAAEPAARASQEERAKAAERAPAAPGETPTRAASPPPLSKEKDKPARPELG